MKKSWLIGIAACILAILAVCALCLVVMGTFTPEATALVRVSRDLADGPIEDYRVFKNTYATLISSPHVLNTAIGSLGGRDIEISGHKQLKQAISIDEEETELIKVSLKQRFGWSKEDTIHILDQVLVAFQDEVLSKERLVDFTKLKMLRERSAKLFDDIVEQSEELTGLAATLGSVENSTVQRELDRDTARLLAVENKLLDLQLERVAVAAAVGSSIGSKDKVVSLKINTQAKRLAYQIQFMQQKLEDAKEKLNKYGVTSGDIEARKIMLAAAKLELQSVVEQKSSLELELDASSSVSIIQQATFSDSDDW